MKNFIQKGNVVTVAAPNDVLSGAPFAVGSLFLVAEKTALSGVSVAGARTGVFSLPKLTTDVDAVGDKLNWDNTNKYLKKAAGDLAAVATVIEAAGNGALVVKCVLTPV